MFVLALQDAPGDVMFSNRELVAANHDAVIVLQLRQAVKWGGEDEVDTGHLHNGRRLYTDGRRVTRSVIAGLAQAIAGMLGCHQ